MNWLVELFKRFLFYVSVPKCVSCKEILTYGDKALCPSCLKEYEEQKTRQCSRCSKKLSECKCSNFMLERNRIRNVIKVYRYNPNKQELPGNQLIYSLKQDNRADVFDFLAEELSRAISNNLKISGYEDRYIITYVPRRFKAIQEYGYDHARELAKRVAKILNIKFVPLLVSKTEKAQKEVVQSERRKNAKYILARNVPSSLNGLTVILVDDIITSGSSIIGSSEPIRVLKPKRIIAASLAIAYKDSYIKPKVNYNYY